MPRPPIRLYHGENETQEFWSQGGDAPVQIIRNKSEHLWWGVTDGTRYANVTRKTAESAARSLSAKLGQRIVLSPNFVFAPDGRRLVPRRRSTAR